MKKLSQKNYERLNNLTHNIDIMRISCLTQGIYQDGISMEPCIFIGPKNKCLILWKDEITLAILDGLLDKVIKDNNQNAAMALLQWAVYNKKRFWQRHKNTSLGVQVMAHILGKHE